MALFGVPVLATQAQGVRQVQTAGKGGCRPIDPPGVVDDAEHERGRDQRERVQDDLARHLFEGDHDRQHRDVRRLVVVLIPHRQRPEVRRRPDHDHREQHDGRPGQVVGDRGPADEHRDRPCRAADDDVLRRTALQADRVDEDVEQRRREGEQGREEIDRPPEQHEGSDFEGDREDDRGRRSHRAGDERPVPGAVHHGIYVAVDDHVRRIGAAGRERTPDERRDDQPPLGNALRGHDHRRQRRDEQQLDDPGLRERHIRSELEPGRAARHQNGRDLRHLASIEVAAIDQAATPRWPRRYRMVA